MAGKKIACLAMLLGWIPACAQDNQAVAGVESLIKAGKYSEAGAALEAYTADHPNSWQALYQLGYVEFRLHHMQHSIDVLCKSLLLKSDFSDPTRYWPMI